jgi:hypothetical protein
MHQICSFLGLAGYYRCFIPDFSRIAKPMTELLKKGVKFVWDEDCEKAFHTLHEHMTRAPILAQPDNTKPFDVYYDTSGTGLGCVLMQDNRVITKPMILSWQLSFTLSRFRGTTLWAPNAKFIPIIIVSNIYSHKPT